MVSFQNFQRLPTINGLAITWLKGNWTLHDAKTGSPICDFDTFLGYSAKNSASVPTNNIEQGSFAAYNKINNPGEFTATLAMSGTTSQLNNFIDILEEYGNSTNLVNLVLPFKTYLNLNITNFNHSLSEGASVNILVAELTFKEIRERSVQYTSEKNALSYKKVANAGDASTVNRGRVQAKEVDSSLLVKIGEKIMEVF